MGTTVLAEYQDTNYSGNFATITRRILETTDRQNDCQSLQTEQYAFHYQIFEGLTILCMAHLEYPRIACFSFLRRVNRQFQENYGQRWRSARAFQFNNDFEAILKKLVCENLESARKADKVSKIKSTIDDTKMHMVENINTILERGEKLEVLVEKSDDLSLQAYHFRSQSRALRRQMCWENWKLKLFL